MSAWRVPERFLKEGYLTADEYQRLARQPISMRLRANVEVIWNETKEPR